MRETLLLATTNAGKLREIEGILTGVPFELVSLARFPDVPEPPEVGATFAENARDKALYYAGATGLPTVAEDSGLAIEALDGAPGVLSARFPGHTFAEKFEGLYAMLDARDRRDSRARFVCALAFVRDGRVVFESTGTVEGRIAASPAGTKGFGYDPIFLYPPLGRTLGELEPSVKASIDHRGRAFAPFREFLIAEGKGCEP